MKLGILGAGMISQEFLAMSHEIKDCKIEAIAATPRSVEKLERLCKEYDIPRFYTDSTLCIADPNVDTVYVALPNNMHYQYVKEAIEAGKNVICEKPFTSTYEEAKELIALAKDYNVMLFEAVTTRYLPNSKAIKEKLPELGNLRIVNMNFSQYSSRYDAFKEGKIAPAFSLANSGGALMDLNIYNINMCAYLFGMPKNVDYLANVNKGIDTSGILVLDYESFKCVCIGAKDCKAPLLSTIQGDEGFISYTTPSSIVDEFSLSYNKKSIDPHALAESESFSFNGKSHRMAHEFNAFAKAIADKDTALMDEMNEVTLITMKIQCEARKKAGIIFPADK